MSYIPTYAPGDLTNITYDTVAKLILTLGSLAAIVVIALLIYFLFKKRR
jgi:hypothetical protein